MPSSKIDFKKYLSIMNSSKLKFKKIDLKNFTYLKNLEGIIKSNEELILTEKVKKYYKKKLNKNIFFKFNINKIKKKIENISSMGKNMMLLLTVHLFNF